VSQITTGLRSILSTPFVYDSFQKLAGVKRSRTILVQQHIRPLPGHRILDIGCGTGTLLSYLPEQIEYIGFDGSKEYIDSATAMFGHRATFVNKLLNQASIEEYREFDRVLATGLLHHLDDNEVIDLFRLAKQALKPPVNGAPGGEFHSLDPCYVRNQSVFSTFMIDRDRGQNVRQLEHYGELARSVFDHVDLTHRNDMRTIPYDNALLRCY